MNTIQLLTKKMEGLPESTLQHLIQYVEFLWAQQADAVITPLEEAEENQALLTIFLQKRLEDAEKNRDKRISLENFKKKMNKKYKNF